MRSMFHAAIDLSWILMALWLSDHKAVVLFVAAALYGMALEHRHPRWRWVGAVAGVGAEMWLGGVCGTGLSIVAMGLGRVRSTDSAGASRYALMAALLAWAALAFVDPALRVVLIAVAVTGLLSQRSWLEDTLGTAAVVIAAALAAALAVVGVLWIVPWDALIANTLGRAGGWVAELFLDLVPHFRPKKRIRQKPSVAHGLAGSHPPAVLHAHFGADVVAVLLVLLVLGIALWLVRSRHPSPAAVDQDGEHVHIQMDTLTAEKAVWRLEHLAPVRAVVRRKIRSAKRHGTAPRAGETFRQWLSSPAGEFSGARIAQIYEQVRYGGAADTKEQAAEARQLWETMSKNYQPPT